MDWQGKRVERMVEDLAAVGREAIDWLFIEHEDDPDGYRGMSFLVDSLTHELNDRHDLGDGPSRDDLDKAIARNPDSEDPAERGAIGTLVLATALGYEDAYRAHLRDRASERGVTGDLADPAVQATVLQTRL